MKLLVVVILVIGMFVCSGVSVCCSCNWLCYVCGGMLVVCVNRCVV